MINDSIRKLVNSTVFKRFAGIAGRLPFKACQNKTIKYGNKLYDGESNINSNLPHGMVTYRINL